MRLFLCEKPSQGRDIAKHVGASRSVPGGLSGNGVLVTWCIGHLLEQSDPDYYLRAQNLIAEGHKGWSLDLLPILPEGRWHMQVKSSTKDQFAQVKKHLASATEVVIATDADREGEVGVLKRVAPMLADPVLTALWEDRLSKVESGEVTLERFEAEIGMFTNKIIGQIRANAGNIQIANAATSSASQHSANPTRTATGHRSPNPENVASSVVIKSFKCPKCAQPSLQCLPKITKCIAHGCGLVLWPTIAQRRLTDQEMHALVSQGRTPVLEGFVSSKTGNFFAAALVLDATWKVGFEFAPRSIGQTGQGAPLTTGERNE